ncbi:hypothetical protein PRIPAC_85748, partial [Pristionchus pacificus]
VSITSVHHGIRQYLVLTPSQLRTRIAHLPRVLQPPRSHPQVRSRHVQTLLPGILQGHRLQEAQLNVFNDSLRSLEPNLLFIVNH